MKSRRLSVLFDVLLEEVERNPDLAERIERAFNVETVEQEATAEVAEKRGAPKRATRAKNRRTPAVLDPVALVQEGVDELVKSLRALELEQLRDIVAEYGMDPQRLVMKWKTKDKVIEHIVAMAQQRARKGEAFRF